MKITILFVLIAVSYCLAGPISSTTPASPLVRHEETHSDNEFDVQFELEDGTEVKEHAVKTTVGGGEVFFKREGSYKYTSPEGKNIEVHYVADENGFHATGAHLPTADIKA